MLATGLTSIVLAVSINPLVSEPEPLSVAHVEASQTLYIEPSAPKIEEVVQSTLTCVTWLRRQIPELPRGDAKDFITNSPFPRIGGVVKLHYPKEYHVGQVVEVAATGIWVDHYMNGKEMHSFVSFDSGLIEGYWSPKE